MSLVGIGYDCHRLAEGRRLVQRAEGYRATVVSGVVTFEHGVATGELPGRLVRGPQEAPALLAAE